MNNYFDIESMGNFLHFEKFNSLFFFYKTFFICKICTWEACLGILCLHYKLQKEPRIDGGCCVLIYNKKHNNDNTQREKFKKFWYVCEPVF